MSEVSNQTVLVLDLRRELQAIVENDLTTYEHHQKRRDGKRPRDLGPDAGTCFLTPREIALAALKRLDALPTPSTMFEFIEAQTQNPCVGPSRHPENCAPCAARKFLFGR